LDIHREDGNSDLHKTLEEDYDDLPDSRPAVQDPIISLLMEG
jgi:hypothetical protein